MNKRSLGPPPSGIFQKSAELLIDPAADARSAGFQTGCVADFQIGSLCANPEHPPLETCGKDSEVITNLSDAPSLSRPMRRRSDWILVVLLVMLPSAAAQYALTGRIESGTGAHTGGAYSMHAHPTVNPHVALTGGAYTFHGGVAVRGTSTSGSSLPNPLPPQPAHWWAGEGNANDSAGDAHGTVLGGLQFATGRIGKAFEFDGQDDE